MWLCSPNSLWWCQDQGLEGARRRQRRHSQRTRVLPHRLIQHHTPPNLVWVANFFYGSATYLEVSQKLFLNFSTSATLAEVLKYCTLLRLSHGNYIQNISGISLSSPLSQATRRSPTSCVSTPRPPLSWPLLGLTATSSSGTLRREPSHSGWTLSLNLWESLSSCSWQPLTRFIFFCSFWAGLTAEAIQ